MSRIDKYYIHDLLHFEEVNDEFSAVSSISLILDNDSEGLVIEGFGHVRSAASQHLYRDVNYVVLPDLVD